MSKRTIRLGTRKSPLAKWQAHWVANQLTDIGFPVDLVYISTQGDKQSAPLSSIGGQGLFTKEIQRALLADEIDLAVHSLKDLPTEPVEGLMIAATPQRESVHDVMIFHERLLATGIKSIEQLAPNSKIGTGSLRRQAQLLSIRNDFLVEGIRGNVDTRLAKLDDGQFDVIVLAEAGLKRLGLGNRIDYVIPFQQMLPAIGQGALGLEVRSDDDFAHFAVSQLNDEDTMRTTQAERSLLAHLRGGCMAPVAARARVEKNQLAMDAVVLSADGKKRIDVTHSDVSENAQQIGIAAAEQLLAAGANELIANARNQ